MLQVQTSSASDELTRLDRDLIAARLAMILEGCARGDVAGVLAHFTPDIVYTGGTWRLYPLSAPRNGRESCGEMLKAIYVDYEIFGSTIERLVIDGDRVALLRTTRLRNRGTGKSAAVQIWNFARFRDGLICEFSEYPDTAEIAALAGQD